MLCGATVLGACGDSSRSADEALASAQAFVSEVTAFEFVAATRTTYVMDAGDWVADETSDDPASEPEWPAEAPGTTTTDRTTTTGAWTSDAWEATTEDSYGRSEEKVFGSTSYVRYDMDDGSAMWETYESPPMSRQDLVDELESMRASMDEMEAADEEDGSAGILQSSGEATGLATSVYLGGTAWGGASFVDDPSGFLRSISELSDPELVADEGGVVTVSAELSAPADIEEAWGAPLPDGVIDLTIAADGAPIGFRLQVGEGDDSAEVEIRFSEWNVPHEITRPADDEIDTTPWIDEEDIAAVSGITLLRPTQVPDGWELNYVDVLTGDDSPEGCDQVELQWSPMPSDESEFEFSDEYLSLYLLPLGCAMDYDDTPFEVGAFAPLPSRDSTDTVEVVVGETVVQVDSSLTDSELSTLVTSLAPTDVESLAAEMSGTVAFIS